MLRCALMGESKGIMLHMPSATNRREVSRRSATAWLSTKFVIFTHHLDIEALKLGHRRLKARRLGACAAYMLMREAPPARSAARALGGNAYINIEDWRESM